MKLFWALALIMLTSCATYRGQNRIQKDTIKFPGGVWQDKTWDETLVMKRNQFFIGATLYYDILTAKIEPESPFANWLEGERAKASKCAEFYVALIYRNIRRSVPQRAVYGQIEEQGGEVMILNDFRKNIREHFVSDEMHFLGHKVRGICFESPQMDDELNIFLPGFTETNIL